MHCFDISWETALCIWLQQFFDEFYHIIFKGTPQKDVIIKNDAPSTLLLEKHADYIAAYGTKKDDYVSILLT